MHSDHQPPANRGPSVIPIAALGSSVALTTASLFFTPNSSGVPASFGNIVQPLVWLLSAACMALGVLVCVPLVVSAYRRTKRGLMPGTPNTAAVAISMVVLCISVLQVLFALFGPDL